MGNSNHSHIANSFNAGHEALEGERAEPLTTCFNDILDSIADSDGSVRVNGGDVLSMQPATAPKSLGRFLVSRVARRQPGRPQHQLALRSAISRQLAHVTVDDSSVDQRNRYTGYDHRGNPRVLVTIGIPAPR